MAAVGVARSLSRKFERFCLVERVACKRSRLPPKRGSIMPPGRYIGEHLRSATTRPRYQTRLKARDLRVPDLDIPFILRSAEPCTALLRSSLSQTSYFLEGWLIFPRSRPDPSLCSSHRPPLSQLPGIIRGGDGGGKIAAVTAIARLAVYH